MNFSSVASDLGKQMAKVVDYILSLNVSPEDKRARLTKVFNLVGNQFFDIIIHSMKWNATHWCPLFKAAVLSGQC